jgi:L-arabinose isomerase
MYAYKRGWSCLVSKNSLVEKNNCVREDDVDILYDQIKCSYGIDDDDVYLDQLETMGVKKSILYM